MSGDAKNLVGIDLGTTMSVIAHLDSSGKVVTIPNSDGKPLTASIIYLDGDQCIVGEDAREAEPERVASFVKRDLGRDLYSGEVDGRKFRPETLSALILKKLIQDAEKKIGPIFGAVITVPAYFDDTRRKATQDAGRIAGLNVLDIINEPTAAALTYAMEKHGMVATQGQLEFPAGKKELTTLVYDLGGGTFDVTVVKLREKEFESIATDGAVELGGKDWDDRIVEYVAEEFRKKFGVYPLEKTPEGLRCRAALSNSAEKAKQRLSKMRTARISCKFGGHDMELELSAEQFASLTRGKLAETEIILKLVMEDAKLKTPDGKPDWKALDNILLVGGSTRMPQISAMLKRVTGMTPDDSQDADQVVAHGAAIHAAIKAMSTEGIALEMMDDLRNSLKNVDIVNVNAYSLAIKLVKQGRPFRHVLIPKNTQLPHAASHVFGLSQGSNIGKPVLVPVLEGEAEVAEHNIQIGECRISGLPLNLPPRSPVQVRLSYLPNGRIHVMALDMTSGHFAQTEISRVSGMSEADIQREINFVNSLTIR